MEFLILYRTYILRVPKLLNNVRIYLLSLKSFGISLMCSKQLMASTSELTIQEILGPFITIIKHFSVWFYWQFDYCFSMFDACEYSSTNDNVVLANSNVGKCFELETFSLPASKPFAWTMDYLLGDEIFPLKSWLLRPYPGKNMTEKQRLYIHKHSRVRRVIENAFGILTAR